MQGREAWHRMTGYFSLVGAALVGLSCLLFGRSYAEYIKGRAVDYSAVLEFLSLMRREISCRLATPRELAARAGGGRLSEVGFFALLEEGESLSEAFRRARDKLALAERDADLVLGYFESFGRGDAAGELRSLDAVTENFAARALAVREDAASQIRLAVTLSVLFALGTIILLL